MVNEPDAWMMDLSFELGGSTVAREHRRVLASAVERVLPWLAAERDAGLHPLNVATGAGTQALLSRRTRLTLRVPRHRLADAAQMEGASLAVGHATLQVGAPHVRELRPWGTLYAHLVAAQDDSHELDFLRSVDAELQALGIQGRTICGRRQVLQTDRLQGYGLMLDGLNARDSLRLLQAGIGRHRRLGCGVFVPHKSAAAVGAPP